MSFFKSILKIGEKVAGAAVGFALGGPVGAAAGATAVGALQGDKGLALVGDAAAGYFGASGIANAANAASAASAAGSVAGGIGPTVGFVGQAQVFGNALLSGIASSPLGTAVSAASSLLGSSGAQTALKVASTGVAAASLLGAGAAASNKGATVGAGAIPANDPGAIASANAAADQVRRRTAGGSAGTILTSPLGLNSSGKSASSLLLG